MTQSYYRNAQGILLVYNVCDKKTFVAIRAWIAQIKQVFKKYIYYFISIISNSSITNQNSDADVNMILIGNQCDRTEERSVSYNEGEALAREFRISFFETSAKQDIHVDESFTSISKDVVNRLTTNKNPYSAIAYTNNNNNNATSNTTAAPVSTSENISLTAVKNNNSTGRRCC